MKGRQLGTSKPFEHLFPGRGKSYDPPEIEHQCFIIIKLFYPYPFLKQSSMNLQSHSESQSFISSEYRPNEESSDLLASCDLPNRKRGKRSKHSRGRASSRNCRGKGYFWSPEDNARYRQFLEENSALFGKSLKERKSLKIHFLMSQHIKTRNPKQCRSHHQKMTKAHGSLESIVAFIGQAKEQEEKVQDRPANPGDSSHEGQAGSGSIVQQGSQKHRPEEQSIWNCLINKP